MCIISIFLLGMKKMDFESEAGSSSGMNSQDNPPSANQPVRNEPDEEAVPGVVVDNGDLEIRDWLRSISNRLDSLETPSSIPHTPRKHKRARVDEFDYSATYER